MTRLLLASVITLWLAAPVGAGTINGKPAEEVCTAISETQALCGDKSANLRVSLAYYGPTEEELGAAIVSAASHRDPCRVKLEAAMRKMEPLIFKTVVPSAIWHNSPAYKDAWELWDAAKRECWREP